MPPAERDTSNRPHTDFYGYAGVVSLPVQRIWTAWTKFTIGLPAADADAPGTSSPS